MASNHNYLDSLQVGRALAALSVVLLHAIHDADRYYPRYAGDSPVFTADPNAGFSLLGAGVDIFFVISGVVMVLSSQRSRESTATFLYRRAARIFPLWWVLTLAYIAMLIAVPSLFMISYFDPVYSACSMLLIPCIGPDDKAIPLIYAGWTLSYELVFYALFALSLRMATRIGKITACVLLVLLWHSLHYTPLATLTAIFYSTENIMLEFLFGVLLAHCWLTYGLPKWAGASLIALGGALLLVGHTAHWVELPRFLMWGVPAASIVAGLMCLNTSRADQTPVFRSLVSLGAASYSLYLFHFFSLKLYFVVLGKAGLLAVVAAEVAVAGAVLTSVIASLLVYRFCEQPLQRLSKLPLLYRQKRKLHHEQAA